MTTELTDEQKDNPHFQAGEAFALFLIEVTQGHVELYSTAVDAVLGLGRLFDMGLLEPTLADAIPYLNGVFVGAGCMPNKDAAAKDKKDYEDVAELLIAAAVGYPR